MWTGKVYVHRNAINRRDKSYSSLGLVVKVLNSPQVATSLGVHYRIDKKDSD